MTRLFVLCLFVLLVQIQQSTCLFSSNSAVVVLSASELDTKIAESRGVMVVMFFADWCGHCRSFSPAYEAFGEAAKGIAEVYAVSDSAAMGKHGVGGFPTVKAFVGGETINYSGPRSKDGLMDFATQQLLKLAGQRSGKSDTPPPSNVIELTDQTFDDKVFDGKSQPLIVLFHSPRCGHCVKMMPEFEKAALKLEGRCILGRVDATSQSQLADRFKIDRFPLIKLFPVGSVKSSSPIDYTDRMEASSIEEFGLRYYQKPGKPVQLVDNEAFQDECKSSVCILAFLPKIYDMPAKKRLETISMLNTLHQRTEGMKFFWSQGGDQSGLEEAFNLNFGYPALVGVRIDKNMFATHAGKFDESSIQNFLTSLATGTARISAPSTPIPNIVTVELWTEDESNGRNEEL